MIIVPVVAFLPAPLAYGIAVMRGNLRYRLDRSFRAAIRHRVNRVFGNQLSPEQRSRVVRDFFRLRSCEAVDAMRLAGKGRALARLVETRGTEHIEAALAAGKGAILCSAHFGSFNCCFSLLGSRGFPITLLARWSYYDRRLPPMRRIFWQLKQNQFWPVAQNLRRPNIQRRKGNFGTAVQAAIVLRQNELIGIMLDHSDYADPIAPTDRAQPIQVNFLGRQASMLPGVITIAQITGAPLLMVFMRRSVDWRHQVLEISPPMPVEGDTATAFRHCLAVLEALIRSHPAHWKAWGGENVASLGLLPA
jgi:KDO2-lipid IV(A) lauroyltransferase